jgi:2-oxoglutarate ferredoxin oxidoreductase subunit alpha
MDKVTIRFAGDSGDGMQLTGTLFSDESALFGNDLATFPDYPSEIRAPAGTVAGVSSFQVQFGSVDIATPGDLADALVAMNPAALKANLVRTRKGAIIVVDKDAWGADDLSTAEYAADPLGDGTLEEYRVIEAPVTSLTREALKDLEIDAKSKERCKNMFALGMMFWLYGRPMTNTENYIRGKFAKKPQLVEANMRVLRAGHDYAQTVEEFASPYRVAPAKIEAGTYRQVSGNQAVALGMIAAAVKCGRELVLGSYPITPASDILHELVKHKEFGVKTVQAEDEIAGICVAIGASFAGALALTTTSGPGLDLKSEAMGLAVMAELPLVIVNVQRGGPSTGLPTKTEQSDLLLALYGRHGESPVPVIAASTPSDCFHYAFESARIALEHMTPVILLTDGYLANGSEPWRIPNVVALPAIKTKLVQGAEKGFAPYRRDEFSFAREWAVPGTAGCEHRLGGLEKQEVSGSVSYDPVNHERMVHLRSEKVARIAADIPVQDVLGEPSGELLVVGWGGTYGALRTATQELIGEGERVSLAHVRYINPLPRNFGNVLTSFSRVVVCELNSGQFHRYLLSLFPLNDVRKYNKVQGLPFTVEELKCEFRKILRGED